MDSMTKKLRGDLERAALEPDYAGPIADFFDARHAVAHAPVVPVEQDMQDAADEPYAAEQLPWAEYWRDRDGKRWRTRGCMAEARIRELEAELGRLSGPLATETMWYWHPANGKAYSLSPSIYYRSREACEAANRKAQP